MHMDRLWGLCLDCFKAGGVNPAECRYEHQKAKVSSWLAGQQAIAQAGQQQTGLGIQGGQNGLNG
jgi:hypothetical protein